MDQLKKNVAIDLAGGFAGGKLDAGEVHPPHAAFRATRLHDPFSSGKVNVQLFKHVCKGFH
jgi:hypothetical protein